MDCTTTAPGNSDGRNIIWDRGSRVRVTRHIINKARDENGVEFMYYSVPVGTIGTVREGSVPVPGGPPSCLIQFNSSDVSWSITYTQPFPFLVEIDALELLPMREVWEAKFWPSLIGGLYRLDLLADGVLFSHREKFNRADAVAGVFHAITRGKRAQDLTEPERALAIAALDAVMIAREPTPAEVLEAWSLDGLEGRASDLTDFVMATAKREAP
jgi:hypothetical protein